MIALFTDYGLQGPYLGQVEATLHRLAPGEKVINLLADAPRHDVIHSCMDEILQFVTR